MKIRIRANTLRFRLTRPEVETLCNTGSISETTAFAEGQFTYSVQVDDQADDLRADFQNNRMTLYISSAMASGWNDNEIVGFEREMRLPGGGSLHLLLEKDFTCLTPRAEDESENYPNPKSVN